MVFHFFKWGKHVNKSDLGCLASACSLHFTSDVVQMNVCMHTLHCNQQQQNQKKMIFSTVTFVPLHNWITKHHNIKKTTVTSIVPKQHSNSLSVTAITTNSIHGQQNNWLRSNSKTSFLIPLPWAQIIQSNLSCLNCSCEIQHLCVLREIRD